MNLPPAVLHPRAIDALHEIDPATGAPVPDAALGTIRGALDGAYRAAQQLINLRDAVSKDETTTPAARELRIRNAAVQIGERAGRTLDQARAKVADDLAKLRVATLPPPPTDPAMAAEIRTVLRGLPVRQRRAVLDKAVVEADVATISALVHAPPLLAGATPTEIGIVALGWRAKHHKETLARMTRIEDGLKALELGGEGLVEFVGGMAFNPMAAEAEARQQRAAEALKAAEEQAA